jgi:CRISPR-associated protein Csa3
MRTYVSPIGYNTTSVTRPVLLSRGLETDDEVVLLRPDTGTEDSRAEGAITDVERMLEEIEPAIGLTTEYVTHEDFVSAALECSDVIRAAEGTIIVSLSGGARDVLVPLTIATVAHASAVDTVLAFSDIDGRVRNCDLPRLAADVSSSARETLASIEAEPEGVSIPELTERSGRAKSTVTRHISQLADGGAVTTWQDGKTKHARTTLTGRLLLRAAQE